MNTNTSTATTHHVLITGAPGTGKSHAAQEVEDSAVANGATVVRFWANEGDAQSITTAAMKAATSTPSLLLIDDAAENPLLIAAFLAGGLAVPGMSVVVCAETATGLPTEGSDQHIHLTRA